MFVNFEGEYYEGSLVRNRISQEVSQNIKIHEGRVGQTKSRPRIESQKNCDRKKCHRRTSWRTMEKRNANEERREQLPGL